MTYNLVIGKPAPWIAKLLTTANREPKPAGGPVNFDKLFDLVAKVKSHQPESVDLVFPNAECRNRFLATMII